MIVEVILGMAGPGVRHTPGDRVEVTDDVAKRWIAAGIAKAVEEAPKPKRRAPRKKASK